MKKLKSVLILTLALCFALFAFASCSQGDNSQNGSSSSSGAASSSDVSDNSSSSGGSSGAHDSSDSQDSSGETEKDDKILIVYFSYSKNTQKVAQEFASQSGGTLIEIVPETPYTAADVNYNDSSSRSQTERRNDSRPEISVDTYSAINAVEYDVVLIGYPIWNGGEPMIIRTLIEHYSGFTGKTIYTFSTSASSGGGSAFNSIKSRCAQAEVKNYLHLTSSTLNSRKTLVENALADWGLKK